MSTAWKKLVDVPSQTPEFSHLSIVEIFDNIFFFAFEHELEEHDVQVCRGKENTLGKHLLIIEKFTPLRGTNGTTWIIGFA